MMCVVIQLISASEALENGASYVNLNKSQNFNAYIMKVNYKKLASNTWRVNENSKMLEK